MKPKNQRIEMKKGGREVDGKFQAYDGLTRDNRITNAKINRGDLPESERETFHQQTFEPRVSANDLLKPAPAPVLTAPAQPTINQNALRTAGNVAKNINGIIEADTAESQRLKQLRDEQSAFGFNGADIFQQNLDDNGVTKNLSELKDINLQLADMQSASDLTKSRISGAEGQTLTQGQREITQEEKEAGIRQMGLAARASVLTDNINTATALARDAVNFAFQDASLSLQNRTNQINDLRQTVDSQTQQLLDAELREIEAEKERVKEVKDAVQAAILAGAPQSDIDAMLSSDTPDDEKLRIAQNAQAASARTDIALDRAQKNASINASNASAYASGLSARKSILELAQGGEPAAIEQLGFDPRDLNEADNQTLAYAQQYATDGKIPTGLKDAGISFGNIASLAKTLPQPKGAVVSAQTGVKDSNIPAAEQGDLSRLYNIVEMTKELKALDEGRGDGIVAGTLNRVFGNEQQNAYLTKRKAIVDEIARMQTGAALTVDEQTFYNDYLPGGNSNPLGLGTNSTAKIEEFASVMDSKLQNALATNGLVIHGYSPVQLGDQTVTVGAIVENATGRYRVNADGSLTQLDI